MISAWMAVLIPFGLLPAAIPVMNDSLQTFEHAQRTAIDLAIERHQDKRRSQTQYEFDH